MPHFLHVCGGRDPPRRIEFGRIREKHWVIVHNVAGDRDHTITAQRRVPVAIELDVAVGRLIVLLDAEANGKEPQCLLDDARCVLKFAGALWLVGEEIGGFYKRRACDAVVLFTKSLETRGMGCEENKNELCFQRSKMSKFASCHLVRGAKWEYSRQGCRSSCLVRPPARHASC